MGAATGSQDGDKAPPPGGALAQSASVLPTPSIVRPWCILEAGDFPPLLHPNLAKLIDGHALCSTSPSSLSPSPPRR